MENVYRINTFPWVFQAWKTTTNIADIFRLSMTVRTLITVTEWAIIIDSKACSFCTLLIVSFYTVICFVCFNWCFSTGVRGLQSYRVISGWQMGGLGTVWLIAENTTGKFLSGPRLKGLFKSKGSVSLLVYVFVCMPSCSPFAVRHTVAALFCDIPQLTAGILARLPQARTDVWITEQPDLVVMRWDYILQGNVTVKGMNRTARHLFDFS